jgi:predicted CXXCH cytochrome family protein
VKGAWAQECIGCHNTLPLGTYLYDDLYGESLPAYQGKMSDRVLPAKLAWRVQSRDDGGLARALVDEIRYLGGQPPSDSPTLHEALPAAATTSEQRLDGKHLVELGIGCEACHNGARVHAANPDVKPSYAAVSTVMKIVPPPDEQGTKAQWINHTCAKCHTVLFTQYVWTWEGGKRRSANPGGSTTTSGEGRDFQLGGCATQMACTTCHDPHTEDAPAKLAEMATPAGDHLCTSCHPKYATPEAAAAHSHHKSTGCIACHMAKKNMGLDYVLDRYHRIGSPDDPVRVEGDRPLECALCHADKSVDALVTQMEQWWGKHYDRDKLRALYGQDLNVNPLRAAIVMGKPHEQAAAISTLGDAHDKDAVELIAPQLAHDFPLVRYFAQRALQNITGDPVAIDVGAPAADVRVALQQWLAHWRATQLK